MNVKILHHRYDGFKVIRTVPKTNGQGEYLAGLEQDLRFSFWNNIRYVESTRPVIS